MDFALPRRLTRAAFHVVRSVPRLTTVLTELRDGVRQLERLATYAANELPEVVYQLEAIRGQLASIERRLGPVNGHSIQPGDEPAHRIHREPLREPTRRHH